MSSRARTRKVRRLQCTQIKRKVIHGISDLSKSHDSHPSRNRTTGGVADRDEGLCPELEDCRSEVTSARKGRAFDARDFLRPPAGSSEHSAGRYLYVFVVLVTREDVDVPESLGDRVFLRGRHAAF